MLDNQTIIANVLAGFIVLVFAYLFRLAFQAIRKAGPWLWLHILKPWMGAEAKRYQDFADSLVGNKTAQIQVRIGARILFAVWFVGTFISTAIIEAVWLLPIQLAASSLWDTSRAEPLIYVLRLFSVCVGVISIVCLVVGMSMSLSYFVALDMATKKEQEQEEAKAVDLLEK